MHLQQAGETLALNPQLFCQQIEKETPAIKIAILVSWHTTPAYLCLSNDAA